MVHKPVNHRRGYLVVRKKGTLLGEFQIGRNHKTAAL